MVGFMTDQVEQDSKRLQMVDEGKITVRESEEQAQEWEKVRDGAFFVVVWLAFSGNPAPACFVGTTLSAF